MTIDRLAAMRAMVTKQPGSALAQFGLANELLKAGLHDEAAVALSAYLAAFDDEGNGWLRYADVLHVLGRVEDARAAVHTGIATAERHGHPGMVAEFKARLEDWSA